MSKSASHVAYVDGVRGVAALLVYVFHFTFRVYNTNLTYGVDPAEASTKDMGRANPQSTFDLIRLPIIRLLYSGAPMVSLFFVISGYSLAHRPLSIIRSSPSPGRDPTLLRHLAGSALRRPVRLFAPCVLSSVMVFIMVRLRIYEAVRPIAESTKYFPVLPHETHVALQPSIFAQIADWWRCMSDLLHNAFGDNFFGGNFDYDVHLWTIPVEFRSSMSLFLALLVSSCLSVGGRFLWWAVLILWSIDGGKWEMILFYAGAALSEMDLMRTERSSPGPKEDDDGYQAEAGGWADGDDPICGLLGLGTGEKAHDMVVSAQRHALAFMVMLIGLFLLSYPEELAGISPGYGLISHLTPKSFGQAFRFWHVCGAVLFTYALSTSKLMQRPFTTAFAQYLGQISYGMYLMHGPVTHSIGYAILGACWDIFGEERGSGFEVGFGVGLLLTTLAVMWAGHVWSRVVDARCVRLARWMIEKLFV